MQIFILCRYRKIIDKHYGERCKWDKKISFIVMFFHVILKQNTFAKKSSMRILYHAVAQVFIKMNNFNI